MPATRAAAAAALADEDADRPALPSDDEDGPEDPDPDEFADHHSDDGNASADGEPEHDDGDDGSASDGSHPASEDRAYAAEAIRGMRVAGGGLQYLVKWTGYAEAENSWEPLANDHEGGDSLSGSRTKRQTAAAKAEGRRKREEGPVNLRDYFL